MPYGTARPDQGDRLLRWRERARRARDDWQYCGMGTEHFLDLFATFPSLWHVKDWLDNDPDIAVTGKCRRLPQTSPMGLVRPDQCCRRLSRLSARGALVMSILGGSP